MLFDKTLTFFENVEETQLDAAVPAVLTGGSDYSRTFIAATLPEGLESLTLTVKTGDEEDGDYTTIATKTSTDLELAAGLMAIPTPLELGKYTKVVPTVAGEPAKGIDCGITDAVPNGILADFGL